MNINLQFFNSFEIWTGLLERQAIRRNISKHILFVIGQFSSTGVSFLPKLFFEGEKYIVFLLLFKSCERKDYNNKQRERFTNNLYRLFLFYFCLSNTRNFHMVSHYFLLVHHKIGYQFKNFSILLIFLRLLLQNIVSYFWKKGRTTTSRRKKQNSSYCI